MNIFVLDENPVVAARYHCDKHVVKMITESAQLLCSVYHSTNQLFLPPYSLSNNNHPCAVWARASQDNWEWLLLLGMSLYVEYKTRYGSNKEHSAGEVLILLFYEKPILPKIGLTPFPLCMPQECKIGDTVQSYREYYRVYKKGFAKYKNTEYPFWL